MSRSHALESNLSTISYPSHIITIKMIKNIVFELVGIGELRADGGGEAVAHGPEAARGEQGATRDPPGQRLQSATTSS